MDSIHQRTIPRSIAGWIEYVERALHNLVYEPEEDTEDDYTLLAQHLSAYNAVNEYMNDPVPWEVFGRSFIQTLNSSTRSGLFVNGGITFCSLVPMRSIPFKVVALMGLNYDKFPRREQPASFNLMADPPQRGDRNVKENDKHLFLETLLSAQDHLYISYTGQNAKDNTSLPPSALVDELIDYIEAGADEPDQVRAQLITRQPMHTFSHKYAGADPKLYNYLDKTGGNTDVIFLLSKQAKDDIRIKNTLPDFTEIDLEELVRFFKNPFKAYYNKVLGIYYDEETVLLGDTELFSLDGLQQWQLKNDLLPMSEADSLSLQSSLVKKGRLPLKNMAGVALRKVEEKVQPVRALYAQATQKAPSQTVSFEYPLKEGLLKGDLKGVFNGQLVLISWSGNEIKFMVEAYIRYLAGTAAGVLSGLRFISGAKKEAVFDAAPLSAKEAGKRLRDLIDIYKAGFEKITAFYPDFFIRPSQVEELDAEKFGKIVNNKLNNSQFPCDDPYIMTEYKYGYFNRQDAWKEYQEMCRVLITPLDTLFPGYFVD